MPRRVSHFHGNLLIALAFFFAFCVEHATAGQLLQVKVTDKESGKPVQGATVFLGGGSTSSKVSTDENGIATLEVNDTKDVRVHVEKSGACPLVADLKAAAIAS